MSDNQLHGIVYLQLKNDLVYEVWFPSELRDAPGGRDGVLYKFSARLWGQTNYTSLPIFLSRSLYVTIDPQIRNIIALRLAYDSLGSDNKEQGAGTGDKDRILNETQTDRNLLRYEILKYTTQRYEEVFEKEFLVMEFVAAISANPSEIIRQLTYFHQKGTIAFPVKPHALQLKDYLNLLKWPMVFKENMKADVLKMISQYEVGMAESTPNQEGSKVSETKKDNKTVFIVHGRDLRSAHAVAGFVEKCGLRAILLLDQPEEGQTIIEKLEKHGDPGFAIVILAPEDEGRLRESKDTLRGRARQNVVFELGFFFGKIGRNRVICLLETADEFEKPSDIHGIVYKPFDKGGAWRQAVAKELKAAGYDIDLNKALS